MDNIERQVEDILKSKGIKPREMTDQEFGNEVFRRLHNEIPMATAATIEKVANEIMTEEMERIGRGVPCRYIDNRKKCDVYKCYDCPNYRPISKIRQNPYKYLIWGEILTISIAVFILVSGLVAPEIRTLSLITWFTILLISRLQIMWMYGLLRRAGVGRMPKWMSVKVVRE